MSAGGGAAGGCHPDFGINAPNFGATLDDSEDAGWGANPIEGKSYKAKDFMEQFGPLTFSTHRETPWRGLTLDDVPNPSPPGLALGALAAIAAAALKGSSQSNPPTNSVNPHAGMEAANQEGVEDGGMGQHSASSLQSLPNQSVVNQALNEANARNKTAARERARALAKEAARLKAKEEHRIQVLKILAHSSLLRYLATYHKL